MTVEFEGVDGRVHHSGLALLLPHGEDSIEIVFSGSVGLDETLDLNLAVKLPEGLMGKGVARDALTREPIQFAVGGTLESPKLKLAGKHGILQSVGNLFESAGKAAGDPTTVDVGNAISDEVVHRRGRLNAGPIGTIASLWYSASVCKSSSSS